MENQNRNSDDASNPLEGKAPAPEQLKDSRPAGENPNAAEHVDVDSAWKKRPDQYPATKSGLLNTDVPKTGKP